VEIGRYQEAALCSICVCGTELTKPWTKEVVGRLMRGAHAISGDVHRDRSRLIVLSKFAADLRADSSSK
jgi:hypothetical protein